MKYLANRSKNTLSLVDLERVKMKSRETIIRQHIVTIVFLKWMTDEQQFVAF